MTLTLNIGLTPKQKKWWSATAIVPPINWIRSDKSLMIPINALYTKQWITLHLSTPVHTLIHTLTHVDTTALQKRFCPEPDLIHNGIFYAPSRAVGDTVTYSCNLGFILIGNATRTCGDDEQWQGDAPVCWSKYNTQTHKCTQLESRCTSRLSAL